MKRGLPPISFLFFVLFLLLPLLAPPYATSLRHVLEQEIGRTGNDIPVYRCTMGAHRGSSVAFQENTISALQAAEDNPAYGFVEFDVQFTGDRKIVVFHDLRLLRLFGRFAAIGDRTYAEISELSEGAVALYTEAMDVIETKKVNIEIKSQGDEEEDERLADAIVADIRARGRENDVMISSISSEVVAYVKNTHPDIPTGQIYWLTWSTYVHLNVLTEGLYEKFNQSQADYLMLHVANLRNIEGLLKLKPPDKSIMFWDFDDRMYLVHKNPTDRLWGNAVLTNLWQDLIFTLSWTNFWQLRAKPLLEGL